jgi:hypothetical protein
MGTFTVELAGNRTEHIAADAYQQEGPLTTFFVLDSSDLGGFQRTVIDSWSRRVASFRTADLVAIRSTSHEDQLAAA